MASTDEHGEQALKLTEAQQALAGISLLPLSSNSLNLANLNLDIRATATLVVDRDRTATLAPQLDVRVLARHVVPGQEVKKVSLYLPWVAQPLRRHRRTTLMPPPNGVESNA